MVAFECCCFNALQLAKWCPGETWVAGQDHHEASFVVIISSFYCIGNLFSFGWLVAHALSLICIFPQACGSCCSVISKCPILQAKVWNMFSFDSLHVYESIDGQALSGQHNFRYKIYIWLPKCPAARWMNMYWLHTAKDCNLSRHSNWIWKSNCQCSKLPLYYSISRASILNCSIDYCNTKLLQHVITIKGYHADAIG